MKINIFRNVDFQRRYEYFSETPVQLFLLHSVESKARQNKALHWEKCGEI